MHIYGSIEHVKTKTPYPNIMGISRAIRQTQKQVTKLRINNEIKHLYAKKQNINKQ
jgi:hypothetical protein